MTDITDEPVVRWMKEAGIADAPHPLVEMFRKVAELARQDEREACAVLVERRGETFGLGETENAHNAHRKLARAIRARGSDK